MPLALATAFLSLASRPPQQKNITVGPNVQVSASMSQTMHAEGMIVADPTDARRLIVCSMFLTERAGQSVAVYRSEDGGAHWDRTFETPVDEMMIDPACTFGPDGIAYLTMLPASAGSMAAARLSLRQSDDGGRTWRPAGVTGGMDRVSISIDSTGGRFNHRVYFHGGVERRC